MIKTLFFAMLIMGINSPLAKGQENTVFFQGITEDISVLESWTIQGKQYRVSQKYSAIAKGDIDETPLAQVGAYAIVEADKGPLPVVFNENNHQVGILIGTILVEVKEGQWGSAMATLDRDDDLEIVQPMRAINLINAKLVGDSDLKAVIERLQRNGDLFVEISPEIYKESIVIRSD